MKQIKTVLAALILLTVAIPAHSWTLGIGATSYYSDWTPEFIGQHEDVSVDPALLAGFALSFSFCERFMLSGQAMFSFLDHTADYTVDLTTYRVNINSNYRREETDVSLMYILNSHFSIFAGYKRLNFDLTDLNGAEAPPPAVINFSELNNQFHIQGPGAGISYKIQLADNLTATLSTSLIYFNMKYYGYFIEESGDNINISRVDYTYDGLGNNTTLNFSCYLDSINTAINLGARCQVIKYLDTGDAPKLDYDLNYGLTLSAMYFF